MTGIAAVEKLNVEEEFYEKTFTERLIRPGPINFTAILTNDSYLGIDQFQNHSVDVQERSTLRKAYEYRKDDIEAVK
jgi:hypothetical protein